MAYCENGQNTWGGVGSGKAEEAIDHGRIQGCRPLLGYHGASIHAPPDELFLDQFRVACLTKFRVAFRFHELQRPVHGLHCATPFRMLRAVRLSLRILFALDRGDHNLPLNCKFAIDDLQ